MSCPFYYWNNHYACRKSGKDVNEDTYYKYCRDYDYETCPIYKQELPTDSRCYLTTACIAARNLPDDCYELSVLRWFRDNYVIQTAEGAADLTHYYAVAPEIVMTISQAKDSYRRFISIYNDLIQPCIALIESREYKKAYDLYKEYSLALEAELI